MIGKEIQTGVVLHPQTERALVNPIQLEQVIKNLMLNTGAARELLPLNEPVRVAPEARERGTTGHRLRDRMLFHRARLGTVFMLNEPG